MLAKKFHMKTKGAGSVIWEVIRPIGVSDYYLCQPVVQNKKHWGLILSAYEIMEAKNVN